MRILRKEYDLPLAPLPNEISLCLDDILPPFELITSALALAFDNRHRILMTNLRQRGWDIPGGHVEAGETPEKTMRREVLEETGAILSHVRLLGYQHIRLLGDVPTGYRYPHPDSYQVLYICKIAVLRPFQSTTEVRQRALFTPAEALSLRWVQANQEMYKAALNNLDNDCLMNMDMNENRDFDP